MKWWAGPVVLVAVFAIAALLFTNPQPTAPITGFTPATKISGGGSTYEYYAPMFIDNTPPVFHFVVSGKNVAGECGTQANPCEFNCIGMDCAKQFEVRDDGAGLREFEIDCKNGDGAIAVQLTAEEGRVEQHGREGYRYSCEHIGAKNKAKSQVIQATAVDWVGNAATFYAKAVNQDCMYSYVKYIDSNVDLDHKHSLSRDVDPAARTRKIFWKTLTSAYDINDGVNYKATLDDLTYETKKEGKITTPLGYASWSDGKMAEFDEVKVVDDVKCTTVCDSGVTCIYELMKACRADLYITEYAVKAGMACNTIDKENEYGFFQTVSDVSCVTNPDYWWCSDGERGRLERQIEE